MAKRPLRGLLARALTRFWGFGDIAFEVTDDLFGFAPLPGDTPLEQAAHALAGARRVLVFVGSGLSAESGVATFRDKSAGGLYDDDVVRRATNASTFDSDPHTQLSWHQRWREVIHDAQPHEGMRALARILARAEDALVVTQNVDDLMERAADEVGVDLDIIHLHGMLDRVRCHDDRAHAYAIPPSQRLDELGSCETCAGRMRPDVVWFGEPLDSVAIARSVDFARLSDVCLVVGTSGLVQPAASLPAAARQGGARVLEINPNESVLTDSCDARIPLGARDALTALERTLLELP